MAEIIEIKDEATWDTDVETSKGPVMVEFFVTWCLDCQHEAPILEGIADQIEKSGVKLYRANAEVMYTKGDEYSLTETPSFIRLEDGKLVQKHEGFLEEQELLDFAAGTYQEKAPAVTS